jgi:hypothetical protein
MALRTILSERYSMKKRLIQILVRISGPLPSRGAPRAEKLAWTRRLYLRILPPQIIVYGLLVILDAPTWLLIVPAVGAAAWLCGFAQVNLEIWRERRRPPGQAV